MLACARVHYLSRPPLPTYTQAIVNLVNQRGMEQVCFLLVVYVIPLVRVVKLVFLTSVYNSVMLHTVMVHATCSYVYSHL